MRISLNFFFHLQLRPIMSKKRLYTHNQVTFYKDYNEVDEKDFLARLNRCTGLHGKLKLLS